MRKKIFIPERSGMVLCPSCDSHGYIQNPDRQPCPKCGAFGFIKKEPEARLNESRKSSRNMIPR
jgi:DnaJ-class molecular chaperone